MDAIDRRADVTREILTYLGQLPQRLTKNTADVADLALQVGNCLLWIQNWIEPGIPLAEQSMDETPQSLYALGKQFRAAGLKLWEETKGPDSLDKRLAAMEKTLSVFLAQQKGGGK